MVNKYLNTFIIATVGRNTLERAIKSALNQHLKTFVVVVFDDEPIFKPVISDDVIYLRTKEHVWGAGARQFGVDWCIKNNLQTTFISFLDDDDYVDNSWTQGLIEFDNYDIVIHSMKIYDNGRIVPQRGYYTLGEADDIARLKDGESEFKKNFVGLSYSLKWEKVKEANLKWKYNPTADFLYLDDARRAGFKHIKTGRISYHQPKRGFTGKHNNRKK